MFRIIGLGLLGSTFAYAAIIGADDRKEGYQAREARLRSLSRSTAILLHRSREYLVPGPLGYRLSERIKTHAKAEALCSDERFGEQPVPGYCSSFLAAPDRLVTVAHCVDDHLSEMQVFFGFALSPDGALPRVFPKEDVYGVTRVVARNVEQDWAVLALDRPVVGREPLRLHRPEMARVGDPVAAVGYPSGLPLKISDNARILEPVGAIEEIYLEADLDVFAGSSGSPAINLRTFEVEGLVAVAFGEHQNGHEADGKPCQRMRHIVDPSKAAPVWVVRASLLPEIL